MAWAGQWTYKIDGTHINGNGSNLITQIPELENSFEDTVVEVPVDGREPSYIRNQPQSGIYTILIDRGDCSWADWHATMASLTSLMSKGPHTLTAQARGMPAEKSCQIIIRSWVPSATERKIAFQAVAMAPIAF